MDTKNIMYILKDVLDDGAVPRNIKNTVGGVIESLENIKDKPELVLTTAIYSLDEVLNDINMPFHTRTEIMSAVSELERLKEESK